MYKWKDNNYYTLKCVHILSSLHSPKNTGHVNRKSKDGTYKLFSCPKVLIDYNKNMNFVDNFDRLNGDYKLDRKSIKWYLRLIFHFVVSAIFMVAFCDSTIFFNALLQKNTTFIALI